MRKDPEEKADWRYEKVKSNAKKQLEILELAYDMLKEGGTLSYSTCSFSYEEDEATILAFKALHPEIVLVNLPADPSFYRCGKLPEAVHLFPSHFEGEGQFICLFKKPGTLVHSAKKSRQRSLQGLPQRVWLKRPFERDDAAKVLFALAIFRRLPPQHPPLWGQALRDAGNLHPRPPLSPLPHPEYSLPISLENAKAYIHGDTFPFDKPDGFYIVSYDNQNMGFVKATQGVAKNHYPERLAPGLVKTLTNGSLAQRDLFFSFIKEGRIEFFIVGDFVRDEAIGFLGQLRRRDTLVMFGHKSREIGEFQRVPLVIRVRMERTEGPIESQGQNRNVRIHPGFEGARMKRGDPGRFRLFVPGAFRENHIGTMARF
jgi:hypothetical protein